MTTDYQSPSKDPANDGSVAGVLRTILDKHAQSQNGMLPAIVLSYNPQTNRATVQPAIMMVGQEGDTVPRAEVASVPVLSLGAGNVAIRLPVKPGDKGWIEASDRDISLYMQTGQEEAKPNTKRMFSFSDGRFIPDQFARAILDDADLDAIVIQTLDGANKIAIDDNGVRIKGVRFEVDAETVFKKTVTHEDEATFQERVYAERGITIEGGAFEDHQHTDVTNGPDISGPPVI